MRRVDEHTKIPKSTFFYEKTTPSIDATSMCGKLSWPSLSAQGIQGLPAEAALLRECLVGDTWEKADGCWRGSFVKPGMVLYHKASEKRYLLGGLVGAIAHVAFEMSATASKGTDVVLRPQLGVAVGFTFVFVSDWDDYDVEHTRVASPAA